MESRKKLAILNNIVPPYRIPIYVELGKAFDTSVILSGKEDNSLQWQGMEQKLIQNGLSVSVAQGITIRYKNKTKDGKVFEKRYLHLNPGYIIDLFRKNPDAVISTEMGFRTWMALLYGSIAHKPVWVWWGGTLITEKNRNSLKRFARKIMAKFVRRWISYGTTSTEYLLHLGVKQNTILQIQNCIDETLYMNQVEPTFTISPSPVFLLAGQFIWRKGFNIFLAAAAQLQKEGYRFSSLLVGDGPEKSALQQLVSALGLESVHFIPPQPLAAMPAVYRSADVFVFPTLEDVWGLVINESLWSGVPVLSSIYAGCTAEIVPPENRFDPLNQHDFQRVLKLVLEKKLQPADISMLLTYNQVAELITNDILRTICRSEGQEMASKMGV